MNPAPTVLHSTRSWLPQTQTWIHSQISELQRLGVDTHVVCDSTENLELFPITNIHALDTLPRWQQFMDKAPRSLRLRRHLRYQIAAGKAIGAQILHSHFGHIGWADLGVARQLTARHVVTFYGLDVNKLPTQLPVWRKRYRELFASADLFLCEGPHMGHCLAALGCPQEKIRVQRLGVDTSRIEFRPRFWQADGPLRVLMAASFREKKGIPDAIEALGRLRQSLPIEVTLIGDAGPDRASRLEKQHILDALRHCGLEQQVRLLGYQSHTQFFQEAYQHHIFLSPSRTAADGDTEGGAPVTLIEMAASGMPIVSTTHCDIPDVIEHGSTGWLAGEGDITGLYNGLLHLARHPQEWQAMLLAGRQRVELEYDIHTQGKKLAKLYQSLL